MFLCRGQFCGTFKDHHESPPVSDDEGDDVQAHKKINSLEGEWVPLENGPTFKIVPAGAASYFMEVDNDFETNQGVIAEQDGWYEGWLSKGTNQHHRQVRLKLQDSKVLLHARPGTADDWGKEIRFHPQREGKQKPKDFSKVVDFTRKATRKQARKSKMAFITKLFGSDRVATRVLQRYVSTEEVEDYAAGGPNGNHTRREGLIMRIIDVKLPANMVKSLRNYTHIHTVELVNCTLKEFPFKFHEMDSLRSLRISRNDLKTLSSALTRGEGKHSKLQRLVLDDNSLRYIEPETLSGQVMEDMVFLDLQKNKLEMLPNDFTVGAKSLQFLILRANQLTVIPTPIFQCSKLMLLDITGNQMTSLPDIAQAEPLPKLRKLYASSNQLTQLPDWIGRCKKLEKIRISSNKLRRLPDNFLDLEDWHHNPESQGVLEELMVDGNPLVVPSITAFEMGGLEQMFRLFREHIEKEKREREKSRSEDAGALAVIPEEGIHYTSDRESRQMESRQSRQKSQGPQQLALMDTNQDLRRAATDLKQATLMDMQYQSEGDIGAINVTQPADLDRMADPTQKDGISFFFADLDQTMINEIRSLESAALLIKKAWHVEHLKAAARKVEHDLKDSETEVPDQFKELLDPNFTVDDYRKRIHPSELDLYFALTVYSVKPPHFSSCRQLFERFASTSPKGGKYLVRKDFDNLCSRVPVKLSDDIRAQLWKVLVYPLEGYHTGLDEEKVEMKQFIAVMHVHDIDCVDPFIERVAKVLRLEYYTVGMKNLQSRILAKNAEGGADPTIDIDSDDEEAEDSPFASLPQALPMMEGERIPPSSAMEASLAFHTDAKKSTPRPKGKLIISKTEAQYSHSSMEKDSSSSSSGSGSDDPLGDFSSEELSGADETESDFDAKDFMDAQREREALHLHSKNKPTVVKDGPPENDGDLAKMMERDPRLLFSRRREDDDDPAAADEAQAKDSKRKDKKKGKNLGKPPPRDPNFSTNVHAVRQILREAFRNLPFYDFVALINFVLRGLKSIKHSEVAKITYWHCDDPILKHVTGKDGQNAYPERLLTEMGFFLLDNRYWIWPERHLKDRAIKNVPRSAQCAGTEKMRLDDMIKLVKLTQTCLTRQEKKFTGHVKHSIAKRR